MKTDILLLFFILIISISCSQNKEELLVGTWDGKLVTEKDGAELKVQTVTKINSDKTWGQDGSIIIDNFRKIEYSANGTWEIQGEFLIFVWESSTNPLIQSGGVREVDKIIELSKELLILDDEMGVKSVYKRIKI